MIDAYLDREGVVMRGFRSAFRLTVLVLLGVVTLGLLLQPGTVDAAAGQINQSQITLNPGGGILANGSDGLRFTINSNSSGGSYDAAAPGQDGVVYRGTRQYCCSAGAPMLNIGGSLYGQSGPAYSSGLNWSSIEILSTSGSTVVGNRTSATGNASATVRYTAVKNARNYIMDRTMTYTYPNDYITDSYTFTIPAGNSDTVKFYLGGDTAPGSSDSGYGIMLTSPVRSVISLNTSSQIMFGFREIQGDKIFDGATSQGYSTPYATVQAGNNIGYVVTSSTHDAGLMMQWNLGSTPGTQTASLQQFATQQGTNLNASFSASMVPPGTESNLNIQAVNTVLSTASNLGYQATLPAGLVIGSGATSNNCGGTLTATAGGTQLSLSGASVAAATNCLVSVPVVSVLPNTYTISAASFTNLVNLTNNVGTSSLIVTDDNDGDGVSNSVEDNAPNDGDANNDNILDSIQKNVTSLVNPVNGQYTSVSSSIGCELVSVSIKEEHQLVSDDGFAYPLGLADFTADCLSNGETTTITQYYFEAPQDEEFIVRKYTNGAYQTIDEAVVSAETLDGINLLVVSYDVTDGGSLDDDGLVNGEIVDPAGPGQVVTAQSTTNPTTNNTSFVQTAAAFMSEKLADTGSNLNLLLITSLVLIGLGTIGLASRRYTK